MAPYSSKAASSTLSRYMAVMMVSFCLGMLFANLNTSSRIAMENVPSGAVEKKQQQEVLAVTDGQQDENEHASHGGGDDFDLETNETLSLQEEYIKKYQVPFSENIQVFEDILPPESRHQEGGTCTIGSKIYLVGGANGTLFDYLNDEQELGKERAVHNIEINSLGHQHVSIYDMEDMTTTFGPTFPYTANHLPCALAPDGFTLHLTGGYFQSEEDKTKASHVFHYALDTSKENSQWERKANMPSPRGGHGCDFMADGRMYCVGGSTSQNGPYSSDMFIYDPATDTWEKGPSMIVPRDHIMESATAIKGGTQLYVPGGRTHTTEVHPNEAHPYHFSTLNSVEIYDLKKKQWTRKKDILLGRAAISVVPYHRFGRNLVPNLLLIGGEQFHGFNGKVERTVDEYDIQRDLYTCLEPLAWPMFGGGVGTHKGKLHVVSGAEWIGLTATRRVQLYDLKEGTPPRQCFYDPVPVFDQWDRLWNANEPYPALRKTKDFPMILV